MLELASSVVPKELLTGDSGNTGIWSGRPKLNLRSLFLTSYGISVGSWHAWYEYTKCWAISSIKASSAIALDTYSLSLTSDDCFTTYCLRGLDTFCDLSRRVGGVWRTCGSKTGAEGIGLLG